MIIKNGKLKGERICFLLQNEMLCKGDEKYEMV